MSHSVRLVKARWLPSTGDRTELEILVEVVPSSQVGRPREADHVRHSRMVVAISRTLQAIWRLDEQALRTVLVAYAKQHIADKLRDRSLLDEERLELTTYNSPSSTPFDPRSEDDYLPAGFDVELPPPPSGGTDVQVTLASEIVELRDQINALFGGKFDARLLSLPQERALSDLSKPCTTEVEFTYRIISLCLLATSIDTTKLPQADRNGSIDRLGKFLRLHATEEEANRILTPLSHFNHLRRMYPVHTDRGSGVIDAFAYFELPYPVSDFQAAWARLRTHYSDVLRRLLAVLQRI